MNHQNKPPRSSDLTGKKFGKLTVIGRAPHKPNKENRRAYNWCQCECGNTTSISSYDLKNGVKQDCGCSKIVNLVGKIFGRLTVIAPAEHDKWKEAYLCQCECGIKKIIKASYLICGDTKSCGCLHREQQTWKAQRMIEARTQFTPIMAAARFVWRNNGYNKISFDDFYMVSQLNCHYCGIAPSNVSSLKNYPLRSQQSIENSQFFYNGIDRIDSSQGYFFGNICSSCWVCNRAKRERTYDQFMRYINTLIEQKYRRHDLLAYRESSTAIDISWISDKTKYAYRSSVNRIYTSFYDDGNLSFQQFYQLSQLNCYYCEKAPSNSATIHNKRHSSEYAKQTGRFIYNGLDRIDSQIKTHDYDNLIPSCKYCNYAKQGLSLTGFYYWIDRLEIRTKEKAQIEICA